MFFSPVFADNDSQYISLPGSDLRSPQHFHSINLVSQLAMYMYQL